MEYHFVHLFVRALNFLVLFCCFSNTLPTVQIFSFSNTLLFPFLHFISHSLSYPTLFSSFSLTNSHLPSSSGHCLTVVDETEPRSAPPSSSSTFCTYQNSDPPHMAVAAAPELLPPRRLFLFFGIRRATRIDFVISFGVDDFSRASNKYVGKIRVCLSYSKMASIFVCSYFCYLFLVLIS